MSRPTRVLSSVALGVVLLSGWGASASPGGLGAPASQLGTFQTTSCPFPVAGGLYEASQIRCGFLVVPENRQRADSRTIKVAVAIFKATQPDPTPDPLVYLIGGRVAPLSCRGVRLSSPRACTWTSWGTGI